MARPSDEQQRVNVLFDPQPIGPRGEKKKSIVQGQAIEFFMPLYVD